MTEKRGFGFLGGAVVGVALVALLVLGWSLGGREALGGTEGGEERSSMTPPAGAPITPAQASVAAGEASPHTGADLDVAADPEIQRLRSELNSAPDRLDLRKQLAISLLRRAQFYAAFDEAQRILEQAPDDVDGLFVMAGVRVRMGQSSRALPLLERVLEQVPDHIPALTAKGQALLKAGHAEPAVAVWTRALELSGGSNAQVEQMLRSVPEGTGAPHPVSAD